MSTELSALPSLLATTNIRKKFEDILGKKAAGFMSSILSAVNLNNELKNAEPMSVISAAAIAASLDLPINPTLGFSCLVPYKDTKTGRTIAQFQVQWKGFVQLGQRTGQYLTMNVSPVCEGELISINPFKGEIILSHEAKKSDMIIGYVAYFKLLNGFEKYLYMTKEQCEKHGKKYSRSYHKEFSKWQQDFDSMALKTVIKQLLSKWGIMSIDMQTALQADQSTIKEDGSFEYIDNEAEEIQEKSKKKGIAGLKADLSKKVDEPINIESEFEKKYFDLLSAINDVENEQELDKLFQEFKSKEMPVEDSVIIIEKIEKRKKEIKK